MDAHPTAASAHHDLQRGACANLHHCCSLLRGVLGSELLSCAGAGLEIARVFSLSHEHLRWCLSSCLHLRDHDRLRGLLSLPAIPAPGRSFSAGLLLPHRGAGSLRPHLLDLDKRRELLYGNRILINGYATASFCHRVGAAASDFPPRRTPHASFSRNAHLSYGLDR